ncbi:hypothetical protein [Streptomyces sp. NPDC001568]|uniref:hypothetical protein n=1 Tax=Streptomyces sp. NPDC001568 TaxID=3364588 RepID=UPI0036855C96
MISEPELDGEWTSERPAEPAGAVGPPPQEGGGGGKRGVGRSWLWALGGAVLASAVWAGVLAAQDRFSSAPPLAYRHSGDLCKDAELKAVSGVTGTLEDRGPMRHSQSPALDWSFCTFSAGSWDEGRTSYYGHVLVELHKKSDPEVEFGSRPPVYPEAEPGSIEVQEVPGLGERALFFRHAVSPRIEVLDGGAVFTVALQWGASGMDSPADAEPDEDAVAAALIEDARALMARLAK